MIARHREGPPSRTARVTTTVGDVGTNNIIDLRQDAQLTFDTYARGLAENARDHGLAAAEWNDREWFEKVLDFIDDLVPGDVIAADDVRSRFGSSPAMGSAFRTARRRGLIESIGHRTSSAPSRHHGEQRLWRRLPYA